MTMHITMSESAVRWLDWLAECPTYIRLMVTIILGVVIGQCGWWFMSETLVSKTPVAIVHEAPDGSLTIEDLRCR